jgi:fumarate reductase subunit C
MPIFWWLGKLAYVRFITRELTSLAVAYAALALVLWVSSLLPQETIADAFVRRLHSPMAVAFHILVVAALVFHSVTWLNLAPKALVLRLGKRRLPDGAVIATHYAAWAVASALVAWVLAGG